MKASFEPSRTVQFMAFSAEEVGLRGSQDIAESYAKEGRDVYAMMQFDMVWAGGLVGTVTRTPIVL